MNEYIWKFVYDSMQQRIKKTKIMKRTSIRTFKVKFLTCNVFVLQKPALSLAKLRRDVNDGVKCK